MPSTPQPPTAHPRRRLSPAARSARRSRLSRDSTRRNGGPPDQLSSRETATPSSIEHVFCMSIVCRGALAGTPVGSVVGFPITECNVILSEASLRAKSKDPHLVASSAWVADPSQAQDDIEPVEDPKRTGRCT